MIRIIVAAGAAIAINVVLREVARFGAGAAFPIAMIGGALVGMAVPGSPKREERS